MNHRAQWWNHLKATPLRCLVLGLELLKDRSQLRLRIDHLQMTYPHGLGVFTIRKLGSERENSKIEFRGSKSSKRTRVKEQGLL